MNFELWAWGDGINAEFSDRVLVKGWDVEPSPHVVEYALDKYLLSIGVDEVQTVFDGNNSHYDVLKDGQWKRVHFLLREI